MPRDSSQDSGNPVSTERQKELEGCLVAPGIVTKIERSVWIVVTGVTRTGQPVRLQAGGILARILPHHIDHLDGWRLGDR